MNKLRNECIAYRSRISSLESSIQEIETDPQRDIPSRVDQRKRLPKLKLELQRIRSKYESRLQQLVNLEATVDMNDAMQKSASRGDVTMMKRLLSQ